MGIASSIFGVQMLGSWLQLLGLVVLGAMCLVSIGYVIASLVRTEESAMPIIQLVQFPMMFLSGIFFPSRDATEIHEARCFDNAAHLSRRRPAPGHDPRISGPHHDDRYRRDGRHSGRMPGALDPALHVGIETCSDLNEAGGPPSGPPASL